MQALLDFGIVINAILVVLGIVWCRDVFGRFRSDLDELRTTRDPGVRTAIILWWAVTALIVLALVDFAVALLGNLRIL